MLPLSIASSRRRRMWTSVLVLALAAVEASLEVRDEQHQHTSIRHRKDSQIPAANHKRSRELYTEDESIESVRGGAGNPNPGGTRASSGELLKETKSATAGIAKEVATEATSTPEDATTAEAEADESRIIGGSQAIGECLTLILIHFIIIS